jgi:hypothetical protein
MTTSSRPPLCKSYSTQISSREAFHLFYRTPCITSSFKRGMEIDAQFAGIAAGPQNAGLGETRRADPGSFGYALRKS